MRELIEQGFEVFVVRDATAAARHPELGDGYKTALVNFAFMANGVVTHTIEGSGSSTWGSFSEPLQFDARLHAIERWWHARNRSRHPIVSRAARQEKRRRRSARTFASAIDVELCTRCGSRMRLRALVTAAASIERFLRHMGESTQPPTLSPPASRIRRQPRRS